MTDPLQNNPLVSVIVRSMGRTELADTLASIAAQDYPYIEVIVVDATGGGHPPLPDIAWRPGHLLRRVGGDRRLIRPMACNVGLDAAQGEWFAFLDDDDTYRPGHISALVRAARARPDAVVVYAKSEKVTSKGHVQAVVGSPFIRAMYYQGVLFLWQAAIIATRVRDLGCRFDETLHVCEDVDFLMQVSGHGEFVFIPELIFRFCEDCGTSGTGKGKNWNAANTLYYHSRLKAKWAGIAERFRAEQMARVGAGLIAYYRGDLAGATATIEAVREVHPDDTYVLATLARMRLDAGALDDALELARRAVEDNPYEPEFRVIITMILDRLGQVSELRPHLRFLLRHPQFSHFTRDLLARLPSEYGSENSDEVDVSVSEGAGSPEFSADQVDPSESIAKAVALYRQGAGISAKLILAAIEPAHVRTPEAALAAAGIAEDLADSELAFGFFRQASCLEKNEMILQRLHDGAERLFFELTLNSLCEQATTLHASVCEAAIASGTVTSEPLHIVGDFRPTASGTSRAMRFCNALAARMRVIPWALVPMDGTNSSGYAPRLLDLRTGSLPAGGSVAIVGDLPFAATWVAGLENVPRVIISIESMEIEQMKGLIALLVQLLQLDSVPEVRFVYASEYLRDRIGLEGGVVILPPEISGLPEQVDRELSGTRLMLGRLGIDQQGSLHPQEAELARRLASAGYGYAMMDGTPMARCFQGKAWPTNMTLYAPRAMPAERFLAKLGVYICWPHPRYPLNHTDELLLAMASGLPVILIGRDNSLAELVDHGVTGYIVDSDDEALRQVDALAADHPGRFALGRAARDKAHGIYQSWLAHAFDAYLT